MTLPYLIEFSSLGNNDTGFLSIGESNINIPFEIKRVFWTYQTPNDVKRGHHAHKLTQQVLICMQGEIEVETIQKNGDKQLFILTSPRQGLYLPSSSWHTMVYKNNAIQLVVASELYDPNDYIRNFALFMNN
ncbi:MAG: FdtA/QdtA family cupin domain-containing protein [Bacteroidota bacterium]